MNPRAKISVYATRMRISFLKTISLVAALVGGLSVSPAIAQPARMVKDINQIFAYKDSFPHELTSIGGEVFFVASDDVHGFELWMTDGTEGGTQMVKEINPEPNWPIFDLVAVENTLFFLGDDGVNGLELWTSDGTAEGTQMVKNIRAGTSSPFPGITSPLRERENWERTAAGSRLFFSADDSAHGEELWVSDGTEEGTHLVKDIIAVRLRDI